MLPKARPVMHLVLAGFKLQPLQVRMHSPAENIAVSTRRSWTHCDARNCTTALPVRRFGRRGTACCRVERRGWAELHEPHGLLVDLHNRELTRCPKRYKERVSTQAQSVRLIVP